MPVEDSKQISQPLLSLDKANGIQAAHGTSFGEGEGQEERLKYVDKFAEQKKHEEKPKLRSRIANFIFGFVVPGLGMLTESYFIITTGQIKTLWKGAYPDCWDPNGAEECPASSTPYSVGCDQHLKASISYVEFAGVMLGMMVMGFIALSWSIKSSAVMTVSCMGVGALLMCISGLGFDRQNEYYLFALIAVFAAGFILLGFGVGGEYPVASVNQTERAEDPAHRKKSSKAQPIRGSSVQLMFSMQGVGAVLGSLVIFVLLIVFKETHPQCDAPGYNQAGYNTELLEKLWRITYALGLPIIIFTILYRIIYMEEPKFRLMHKESSQLLLVQHNQNTKTYKLIAYYWHRLIGTSLTWMLWDVSFYGNKLFSAPIVNAIYAGKASLYKQNLVLLLIVVVSLVGYYVAAFLLDKKWYGRTRMQFYGFFITGALFLYSGIRFDMLREEYPHVLIILYLIINFFGQLGPNATTYILPSELFPTDMRTATHGFSAFCGKMGALMATIAFGYASSAKAIFLICAVCGLVGALFTLLFVPNVSHLDLAEADLRWQLILAGNHDRYGGEAIRKDNLSLFERVFYGWQKQHGKEYQDSEML
eukprot:TRINITY_DN7996_c0_g2_i4.p1 TRINITY_DN7996_c0_g2~~TRINITY_DN7996_c0_g2_i4.p1  ORF type:complete len:591 (-),score=101.15 TRINITY_DN7996_c0_g2_i4:854-2626(-)